MLPEQIFSVTNFVDEGVSSQALSQHSNILLLDSFQKRSLQTVLEGGGDVGDTLKQHTMLPATARGGDKIKRNSTVVVHTSILSSDSDLHSG